MILKSLSRKSSPEKLIRYIFKEQLAYWESKTAPRSHKTNWYVPGVKLTERDIRHLEQEKEDGAIMKQLSLFKGTVQEFIQERLLTKGQKEKPFIITYNTRARTLNGFYKAFAENESRRLHVRSDMVRAHHVILSWSPKDADKITDAILKDIAGEYIRLRGDNCLIVGSKHTEGVGHKHLHLAVAGNLLNGKSARQSKADFQKLKDRLQEYQREKYPFLSHSLPRHGKSAEQEKSTPKNLKPERFSERNALLKCLDEVYSKSESREHFIQQLEALGHPPYYRAGRFQGILYNGTTKYRIYRYGYDEAKLLALDTRKAEVDQELREMRGLRHKGQTIEKRKANDMTAERRALLYEETADPKRQEQKRAVQQELVNASKAFERGNASISDAGSSDTRKSSEDKKDVASSNMAETGQDKERDTLKELHDLRENADREQDDGHTNNEIRDEEDTPDQDNHASDTDTHSINGDADDDTSDTL